MRNKTSVVRYLVLLRKPELTSDPSHRCVKRCVSSRRFLRWREARGVPGVSATGDRLGARRDADGSRDPESLRRETGGSPGRRLIRPGRQGRGPYKVTNAPYLNGVHENTPCVRHVLPPEYGVGDVLFQLCQDVTQLTLLFTTVSGTSVSRLRGRAAVHESEDLGRGEAVRETLRVRGPGFWKTNPKAWRKGTRRSLDRKRHGLLLFYPRFRTTQSRF